MSKQTKVPAYGEINLCVEMPDGSIWSVPVHVIANNRAKHYASEFGGDVQRSLQEDTWPLFLEEGGNFEIKDWAANQMNWSDVEDFAALISDPDRVNYQEGWCNGTKYVSRKKEVVTP